MLEEAADDRDHADVLGDALDSGPQRADAPDVEVDLDAGLRGPIEGLDAGRVEQRVHLHPDPGRVLRRVRLDRALDLAEDPLLEIERGDPDLAVSARPRVAGQVVEHLGDVLTDLGVRGEEAEVGVDPGGLRVVVAGPDVDVVADAVALAARHQDALDVGLQTGDAVDDVHARLLQRPRPADVRALVEASLELHQADRLLAALRGLDQRRDQRRVGARPVDGLLDREDVRVLDRLADEALNRSGEGVVGMVDQDVALADRGEDVDLALGAASLLQRRRRHSL